MKCKQLIIHRKQNWTVSFIYLKHHHRDESVRRALFLSGFSSLVKWKEQKQIYVLQSKTSILHFQQNIIKFFNLFRCCVVLCPFKDLPILWQCSNMPDDQQHQSVGTETEICQLQYCIVFSRAQGWKCASRSTN